MSIVNLEISCPECSEKALIDHETRTHVIDVYWNNCKCGLIKEYEENSKN